MTPPTPDASTLIIQRLDLLSTQMADLHTQNVNILNMLFGERRANGERGLVQDMMSIKDRVHAIEMVCTERPALLAEHRAMMAQLAEMESTKEKTGDRFWTVGWDIIRIAMAALFGALVATSKGPQ